MTKYSGLLEKANLFKKMAVYGNRKSFLKAIAAPMVALTTDIKEGLDSLIRDLSATKPSSIVLQNKLMDALNSPSVNVDELFHTVQEAANTIPGDHTTQVQRALDLSQKIQQLAANPSTTTNPNFQTSTPATSTKTENYPAISKETQRQLNVLLVPSGDIMPLKLDGQLGPLTQKALEIFKTKYNVPATPVFIKEVYLKENNPEITTKVPF